MLVSHETKAPRLSDMTWGLFVGTNRPTPTYLWLHKSSQPHVVIAKMSFILHSCTTIPVSRLCIESKNVVVWKNCFDSSSFFHHKAQVFDWLIYFLTSIQNAYYLHDKLFWSPFDDISILLANSLSNDSKFVHFDLLFAKKHGSKCWRSRPFLPQKQNFQGQHFLNY